MDINLDKLYEDRFKCLYNEIVNFTIEAQKTAQNEEDMKIFIAIRRASLRLAEILKDLETVYPNLNEFLNSSNHYIKDEYNKLRIKAFKSINIANSSMQLGDEKDMNEKLSELKSIVKSYDLTGESDMGRLLSKNLITSSMATSLMNDTLMIKNISKNLEKIIKMGYEYYKYKLENGKSKEDKEENKETRVDENLAK